MGAFCCSEYGAGMADVEFWQTAAGRKVSIVLTGAEVDQLVRFERVQVLGVEDPVKPRPASEASEPVAIIEVSIDVVQD